MVIEPTWASDQDQFFVFYKDSDPATLVGADISFDLYVPQEYVTDGKAMFQLYFNDSNGVYANIITKTANGIQGDQYVTFSATNIAQTGGTPLDWASPGFDETSVNLVGLQVVANGKPTTVTGNLMMDNFVLTLAEDKTPTTPTYNSDFAMDSGWTASYGALTMDYSDVDGVKSVWFEPGSGDTQFRNLIYVTDAYTDLTNATVSFALQVDQAFIDSGATLQAMVQQAGPTYDGVYCPVAATTTDVITVDCLVNKSLPLATNGTQYQIGVQVTGDVTFAGRVTIYSVEVEPAPAS